MAPDNNIGRFISDTVASIPKLSSSAFEKLVNDSIQVRLVSFLFPVSLVFILLLPAEIWLIFFASILLWVGGVPFFGTACNIQIKRHFIISPHVCGMQ